MTTEPESFERRRAVERKHGRIAMVASIGIIVHNNHIVFDGYISPSNDLKFSDVPTGFSGLFSIPTAGIWQIGVLGNMVGEGITGQTMYEQYAAGHFNPFSDGVG